MALLGVFHTDLASEITFCSKKIVLSRGGAGLMIFSTRGLLEIKQGDGDHVAVRLDLKNAHN